MNVRETRDTSLFPDCSPVDRWCSAARTGSASEQAITEGVNLASHASQQVINDLQALRGIADISAVTIAAELGQVSRFVSARQLKFLREDAQGIRRFTGIDSPGIDSIFLTSKIVSMQLVPELGTQFLAADEITADYLNSLLSKSDDQ